ncbi:CPBP family intramembrane glutamic endopeptidase [Pedobacter arcticus]|uniref:CPBP family intramembrane glutamic endopeptidase n=1 Tax=Pedobacter arcticus TaxID=752140 RepID=UPI0004744538|nr:CPBP family intramembrane glutamic endopeptidase [Pedobacter arcticus]
MPHLQKANVYHPWLQIMFLILCTLVGAVVFTIIGLLIWFLISGNTNIAMLTGNPLDMDINLLRAIQISSSSGMFIAGPIAFAYINEVNPKHYYYFDNKLNPALLLTVFLLMLFAIPIFEWVALVNQKMNLPAFLKELEIWMKAKELEAGEITKKLLVMKDYGDLAITLLMVAVIPAIGEELFFRGGLQNILGQWFKNHHTAIWVTAIIFSAIHMQFYGFFPRMILGALFGYLLVYGQSIYLPILGHFLNNGSAVLVAFVMQKQGKGLDNLDQTSSFNTYGYLISAIITLALLFLFFKQTKKTTRIYG